MKHTKEEIINALKVIKDECENNSDCIDCPFGAGNCNCKLKEHVPSHWKIVELKPETWRVLK